ncbi:prefoldin subunit 1 [Monoraphidium neglectum]|uniref:Prefoldin subunit 1 n=1 Tax=Monoraphidium neglectum TaxID=145388 RepID=A0A0D2MQL2_9CHLO|nr:prefoldin subunit 1 [Monoraphidium neglectum]KIY96930.1 prefoldin subunit 1 [Monoraphidium neglectum]|eukprot:XP_013895950.1 prefoldin subunit 1 [Monoraphidium neglectum]
MSKEKEDKDAQTLLELRDKLEMNGAYLAMVQNQQRRTGVNLRRAQLTLDEVQALPESVAMYKAVGKAYFLAPKAELVSELSGDVKAGQDQAAELERQQERAVKAIKAIEGEVAEVARGNPGAQQAFRRLMGGA